MSKLKELAELCKAEIHLTYRGEANCYKTLKEVMEYKDDLYGSDDFETPEDLALCLETDKYWTLHFYPDTPVGFYRINGSSPDRIIDWAIELIKKDRGNQ